MRGSATLLILVLLMSQSNLAREKKAEYAHEGRAVLGFIDREFWDREEGGFLSNPYGKPIRLCDEQALVAAAHYALYNATREKRYLERGDEVMTHLAKYRGPSGGCNRVLGEPGPLHIQEQAVVARTYIQAYRSTGNEEYRSRFLEILNLIVSNMTLTLDGKGYVTSWWDPENGTWERGAHPCDYFEPARSLFMGFVLEGNQTYLGTAKLILKASDTFWDPNNYGYGREADADLRYSRDHAIGALAYLSAYDVTNRKDYLERAKDILFYMVSRMGDQVSRTFYEAIARDGKVHEPSKRLTVDHLLLVQAYLYAYKVTLEEKYLNQGENLLDAILNRGFDRSESSFTDQVTGGVMGDLEVQAHGALTLIAAYDVLTVGPSPLIAVLVISVLAVMLVFMGYLFKRSWPY